MSVANPGSTSLSTLSSALAPTKGRRKALTREAVFDRALDIVDREGLGALTMRRLADEVGVALKTLYSAVGSKEEVLGGVIDAALQDLPAVSNEADAWDTALIELTTAIHESLMAHPAVTQLAVVQRRVTGPRLLQVQETILKLLRTGGLRGQALVDAYTSLISYVAGFTLLRITRSNAGSAGKPANLQVRTPDFTPQNFPELHQVSVLLQKNTSTERFHKGLRNLVHSLGPRSASKECVT